VEADALQVDTQSAAASGLINGTQIRELALSARNYEELVALTPGVSSAVSDTHIRGVETPGGGTNEVDFSINGNRSRKTIGRLMAPTTLTEAVISAC